MGWRPKGLLDARTRVVERTSRHTRALYLKPYSRERSLRRYDEADLVTDTKIPGENVRRISSTRVGAERLAADTPDSQIRIDSSLLYSILRGHIACRFPFSEICMQIIRIRLNDREFISSDAEPRLLSLIVNGTRIFSLNRQSSAMLRPSLSTSRNGARSVDKSQNYVPSPAGRRRDGARRRSVISKVLGDTNFKNISTLSLLLPSLSPLSVSHFVIGKVTF